MEQFSDLPMSHSQNETDAQAPTIAVAGPASVDMTIHDPPAGWIGDTGRDAYTPTTLFQLEAPVDMGLGGNGGASAYVLGKLGLNVQLNAPVGQDPAGQLVRSWLREADVEWIAPPDDSTMIGITTVDCDDRRLGTVQYVGSRINWALSTNTKAPTWLLVAIHAAIEADELPVVQETMHASRQLGRTNVLDSGIGWLRKIEAERVIDLWSRVDIVVGTVEELGHWTGQQSPELIADAVQERGPHTVVVKMGAGGAAYQSRTEPFGHQPACRVGRAGLSIGAGDSFNGALVAALACSMGLPEAVTSAQQVASKVVEEGKGVLGWGRRFSRGH